MPYWAFMLHLRLDPDLCTTAPPLGYRLCDLNRAPACHGCDGPRWADHWILPQNSIGSEYAPAQAQWWHLPNLSVCSSTSYFMSELHVRDKLQKPQLNTSLIHRPFYINRKPSPPSLTFLRKLQARQLSFSLVPWSRNCSFLALKNQLLAHDCGPLFCHQSGIFLNFYSLCLKTRFMAISLTLSHFFPPEV